MEVTPEKWLRKISHTFNQLYSPLFQDFTTFSTVALWIRSTKVALVDGCLALVLRLRSPTYKPMEATLIASMMDSFSAKSSNFSEVELE